MGTTILGMCWDLQRAPLAAARGTSIGGGILGCQALQGIQDGFCGCLTTVSTWVLELMSLRRRHAYIYGGLSGTCSASGYHGKFGLVTRCCAVGLFRVMVEHDIPLRLE
jgi:fluoride ion exporter CrcB/FEX